MKSMTNTPDKIYIIMESTGYDDTHYNRPIGFTYTKTEATRQVNKIRKLHNIQHPLSEYKDDYEQYNYYRNVIDDVAYDFDEQYDDKYCNEQEQIFIKYRPLIKHDRTKIDDQHKEIEKLDEKYFNLKVKFFNKSDNENLQNIIKSLNITWEEYWRQSDAYDEEQSKEFNDAYFEEVSLLK